MLIKMPRNSIPNIDHGLSAGDVVKFGKSLEIEILDTLDTLCRIYVC